MVAAAGVTMMLLVGMLAVTALVGSGGAGSPEGAVQRLADAITHEDPLEAVDVLSPSEVRTLHGTVDATAKKLAELKLVNAASAPLAGIDLNVTNLKLRTESLGDGFAKVIVDSGTISGRTEKAKFSPIVQKLLRESDDSDNTAEGDIAKAAEGLDMPTFVVAVREDGGWYVSAAYTILEYVREYNDLPAADYGGAHRDIAKLGSDSPGAAVEDAVRALAAVDADN
jgi:hypothetical protein